MAGSESRSGKRDLLDGPESVSLHSSMRTGAEDAIPKINQRSNTPKEGAKKEVRYTDRYSMNSCLPVSEDFVNDEMSVLGSIDFVALGRLKDRDGSGSTNRSHQGWANQNGGYTISGLCLTQRGVHVGGVQIPLNPPSKAFEAPPGVISKRKAKAKSRKRRQKALKALKAQSAQMMQAAQAVQAAQALSTIVKQKDKPEQEAQKRKESPTAADEPEPKTARTESRGGDEANNGSTNKTEAEGSAAVLVTAPDPGAEGQSSDAGRLTEETNEDSVPANTSAAEGQSCTVLSTEQTGTSDGTWSKQGQFGEKMKITAHRISFECSVCKFRSFYRKNMVAHLKSKFHKDHFEFLTKHFPEPTVDFLQTYITNKHKRVEGFVNHIPNHHAAICQLYEDRDLTQDISMEHFMRKAESAHCLACDVYIPMQHSLIKRHLKSFDHDRKCKIMMVQSKNSGLSFAQSILSHRSVRKKLKCFLKNSKVTDEPGVKPEEAWSTGQRAIPDAEADMMTQEAEPSCEQVVQATEAVRDEDQEVEPSCEQVVQVTEAVGHGEDQEAEPSCEQVVQVTRAVGDEDQEVEPFCEQVVQATEAVGRGEDQEVEPSCEQVVQVTEAVGHGEDQEVEPFCEQVVQATEAVGDGEDQEVEPFCEQVVQATEAEGDGEDQEVEPLSEGAVPATEAEPNGKEQQAEPVCEGQEIRNEDVQEEREEHDQTKIRFDLLDEEEDVDGVELGEEELGEDDYI